MDYLHTISYQTKYNISPTLSQSGSTPHISFPLGISSLIPMLLIFAPHKNKIGYLLEKGEGCRIASVCPKTDSASGSPDFWGYHSDSYCFFCCKVQQFLYKAPLFPLIFSDCVYSIKEHYHHTTIPLYNLNWATENGSKYTRLSISECIFYINFSYWNLGFLEKQKGSAEQEPNRDGHGWRQEYTCFHWIVYCNR